MKATPLTDRQKSALKPFVRRAEQLEKEGALSESMHHSPEGYFTPSEWLALIYAFETLV